MKHSGASVALWITGACFSGMAAGEGITDLRSGQSPKTHAGSSAAPDDRARPPLTGETRRPWPIRIAIVQSPDGNELRTKLEGSLPDLKKQAVAVREELVKEWFGKGEIPAQFPQGLIVRIKEPMKEDVIPLLKAKLGRTPTDQEVKAELVNVSGGSSDGQPDEPPLIELKTADPTHARHLMRHEIMHLLVKEKFKSTSIPLWLSEGLAMSVEPSDQREKFLRFAVGTNGKAALPIDAVLSTHRGNSVYENTSGQHKEAIYGMSLGLVQMLADLPDGKNKIFRLVQHGISTPRPDWDRALADTFGGDGITNRDDLGKKFDAYLQRKP